MPTENKQHFDLHVSAESLSSETRQAILALGFAEDFLRNNRNSEPPHFHATYKSHYEQPDDGLWKALNDVVRTDAAFSGCLEEERQDGSLKIVFEEGNDENAICNLPRIEHRKCKLGEHKICDLHMTIDHSLFDQGVLDQLDSLNFISFERLKEGRWMRIYSLTFTKLVDAKNVFQILSRKLVSQKGLSGKMKIETINRFSTIPEDAEQLPLTTSAMAERWVSLCTKREVS